MVAIHLVLCRFIDVILPAWETIEHHHALRNDEKRYSQLKKETQNVMKEASWLYHANFPVDLTHCLNAPVTEIAVWTLKETADSAKFYRGLQQVMEQGFKDLAPDDYFKGACAPAVESDRIYMVVHGWFTVEVGLVRGRR